MLFDKTLILAAGKGTRMGEIGKELPKVLWPIFEKTILELEIDYAKRFGSKTIFVNTHYYTEALSKFFETKAYPGNIKLVKETEAIDIGGAIHNIANKFGRNGELLVVNSDQFLMLDASTIKLAKEKLQNVDGILFTCTVNSNDLYNSIDLDEKRVLRSITSNEKLKRDTNHETYIGISIINLKRLGKSTGASKFFDSVANPEKSEFHCINVDQCNYWDFGTSNQYYDNMFRLITVEDEFKRFLVSEGAFDLTKIGGSSYGSKILNSINLSKNSLAVLSEGSILLDGPGVELKEKGIIYRDFIQYRS